MKAVLMSIQPKWCEKIAYGEKTIEVRKTRPKIETPFKCYIYKTKEKHGKLKDVINDLYDYGKVIGEFVCDKIDEFHEWELQPGGKFQEPMQNSLDNFLKAACLTLEEVCDRRCKLQYYQPLYLWRIADLKIYDTPKELGEFRSAVKCPQAYCSEIDGEWYCEDGYTKNAVVDRTQEYPFNEECIYFDCPSVGGECSENEDYAYCMCKGYKPLIRPPQSWCYVEELNRK